MALFAKMLKIQPTNKSNCVHFRKQNLRETFLMKMLHYDSLLALAVYLGVENSQRLRRHLVKHSEYSKLYTVPQV